jgi:uncharacterized protein (DUF1015 family)
MARVLPFRAVRPNVSAKSAANEPLAERLSPPYDVISRDERARLARSPHNPVHLILPEDDQGEGSRYARARSTLQAWLGEAALARDGAAAFYPYEQRFEHRGTALVRRGFFGLLELAPFGEAGVHAHEKTLTAPKEDRFRLLEATKTNLSPVFVLYEDDGERVKGALDAARATDPLGRATTKEGDETLWSLEERSALGELATVLGAQGLVLADGHHRYESALRYRAERRAAEPGAHEPQAYDFMLACFVEASDPGLLVLPTHRVVRGIEPFDAERLAAKLGNGLTTYALGDAPDAAEAVRRAEAFLESHPAGAFVLASARGEGLTGIVLDPAEAARRLAARGVPEALRALDVVQLHELLLGEGLGITAEALAAQSHVEYVKSTAEAVRIVRGEGGAGEVVGAAGARAPAGAFLMNGTPIGQVLSVARSGERMPQKSTYFLPKITTGWTYHVHGAPDEVWGPGALDLAMPNPHPA